MNEAHRILALRAGWTDERTDLLTKRWLDGHSATQIAKELGGVTRSAVIAKVHRLKLPQRSEDAQRQATIAATKARAPRPAPETAKPKLHPAGNRVYLVAPDRPLPPETADGPGLRTILTIRPFECRWPNGDPRDDGFTLCGQRRDGERPYCVEHARRAYVAAPPSKRTGNELARGLRRYL